MLFFFCFNDFECTSHRSSSAVAVFGAVFGGAGLKWIYECLKHLLD